MNTYEHFFWNYVFFCRKQCAWKAGVGGLFPDLIYMVGFIPVMDMRYFSPSPSTGSQLLFLTGKISIMPERFFGSVTPFYYGMGISTAAIAFHTANAANTSHRWTF
ncbi:MAG: hypothetical protein Q8P24_08325 [Desulfobacterales bacterium]|nr:hypothetical protein [Desulfobacterales bacterium]